MNEWIFVGSKQFMDMLSYEGQVLVKYANGALNLSFTDSVGYDMDNPVNPPKFIMLPSDPLAAQTRTHGVSNGNQADLH